MAFPKVETIEIEPQHIEHDFIRDSRRNHEVKRLGKLRPVLQRPPWFREDAIQRWCLKKIRAGRPENHGIAFRKPQLWYEHRLDILADQIHVRCEYAYFPDPTNRLFIFPSEPGGFKLATLKPARFVGS